MDVINEISKEMIISYKLETVNDCNNILVFKEGKLIEQGTHTSYIIYFIMTLSQYNLICIIDN